MEKGRLMAQRRSLLRWGGILFLFLLAFLPRAIHPVSRPLVWYLRSAHFVEAVLAGDWANTVYSEHPGVGLMWPVGFALKTYWSLANVAPAAHTVPPDFEPIHFFGPVDVGEIAVGVAALALLISLGIVGIYWMVRRLFGEATGWVTAALLALSPYYLTQSKVLHLDAWMGTVMLLSGLAMLLYRRERQFRWLLLSGGLGGLALLIKTPALFLIPFLGLCLVVEGLESALGSERYGIQGVGRGARDFSLWLLVAALIYFALWPVLWVEPGRGLRAVAWGLTHHAGTAHDTPTYFMGQVTLEDPGPVFYAVAFLFRTSAVELIFLFVAGVLGAAHLLRHRHLSNRSLDYLLLLAYALFFLAQMSLGAKKMPRYVLPAIMALDVLAAAGIVAWARRLAGGRRRWGIAMMVLPLLIQALLLLPHHPYYGTTFNRLAGGPPAAAQAILIGEEGEGLAELAADLNDRAGAEELTVAAQLLHVFNQTFEGRTVEIYEPADYLVFHRNYTVRDYKIKEWGPLWERYGARTPERLVQFGGVDYAWLYPALTGEEGAEHPRPVDVGDRFRFLGYDLQEGPHPPGARIPLVLYWQATEPITADLSIFLHLLDPAGELVWQDDGAAAHGALPTWSWTPGEVIVDPHTVILGPDLPEGAYRLTTGLYDWRTGERLPTLPPGEDQEIGDQIELATLTVHPPRTPVTVWIARGVAGLVLASALVVAGRSNE